MVSSILLLFSDPDDFSRHAPEERGMPLPGATVFTVSLPAPGVFP